MSERPMQGGDIVIAKVRELLGYIRLEERILLATWLIGYLAVVRSNSGFDATSVFSTYLGFFGMYIVYLLVATRVLFWLGDGWKPTLRPLVRLRTYLWGPPAGAPVDRVDEYFIGNAADLRGRRRPGVLAMDVEFTRGLLLLIATLTMYSNIKARLPIINATVGDEWFQRLDHAVFGERLIASIETWFAGDPGVARYFADVFMHEYVWLIALVLVLYVRRDAFTLRWLMLSLCLTYIVSILISVAYPSYGPSFMEPARFAWLDNTPIGRAQSGLALFHNRAIEAVLAGRDIRAGAFAGIAAFPSAQVGQMIVVLVVALRAIPIYALWMAWMAAATSLAAVGFGYDYAIDAIGGILIAAAVTEGLYRLMQRRERQLASTDSR